MQITKTSILSGVERTREIDVEPEQLQAWKDGMLIQEAMPHLSDGDREFIQTGATQKEWDDEYREGS